MTPFPIAAMVVLGPACLMEGKPESSTPETGAESGPTMETAPTESPPDSDDSGVMPTLSWRLHESIGSLVYVSWEQPTEEVGRLTYQFGEGEPLASPEKTFTAGFQEELLLGIPYGTEVAIRLVTTHLESDEVLATTDPLPARFPEPWLTISIPDRWEPTGNWLLGSINGDNGGWTSGHYWMFILDREGRVVWTYPGHGDDMTLYLHISKDNDILWDQSTFWSDYDDGAGSMIHRMKIDGTITESISVPGMHHCFTELPDGSIVWGATDFESETEERIAPDGTQSTLWDCRTFRYLDRNEWCHTNSLFYRESTHSLLMSFPTNESFVADLDLDTGEILNWWGHVDTPWTFEPFDSAFWYQHGVTWTDAGTLLVSTHAADNTDEGMVREYEVDETNQVLREIWSFGEGDGIDADNAGEAHRLPSGNTLHNTGTTPRIREITADGVVVWDVQWSGSKLLGRTVFLEDIYTLTPL